jgi:Methyladenine glycosylase
MRAWWRKRSPPEPVAARRALAMPLSVDRARPADVFEVGLSWSVVFGKRDAFRKAFRDFDVANVAAMTSQDVDRLVADASIIRNRAKIQATVDNARAMLSASPSLVALAKSYEITRKRAPRRVADLLTSTPAKTRATKERASNPVAVRGCVRGRASSGWTPDGPSHLPRPGRVAPPVAASAGC